MIGKEGEGVFGLTVLSMRCVKQDHCGESQDGGGKCEENVWPGLIIGDQWIMPAGGNYG